MNLRAHTTKGIRSRVCWHLELLHKFRFLPANIISNSHTIPILYNLKKESGTELYEYTK